MAIKMLRQMYLVMCFLINSAIIPTNSMVEFSHSKKLEKSWSSLSVKEVTNNHHQHSVVTFPVTALPFEDMGYVAHLKLGNPPKEFRLYVDTGSEILWVPCNGCTECPLAKLSNELLFDPQQSSTASVIGCLDSRCIYSDCSDNCLYNISYAGGDTTSGYFVSDELHISMVMENKQVANSSIPIIFGCSNFVFGSLAANKYIDGILGLSVGSGLSVFSQLSSAGVSPMVFSHCLGSTQEDSGSLFFEAADEPGVKYTHMYPFESRYNLYLRSIVVNGQPLPIDPLTFEISKTTGAVIDSGTPLVYIPEEVHRPFVNALCSSIRPSQVNPIIIDSNQCFETNNSVYEEFPVVTINFVDASMELNPLNYLELYETIDTKSIWCIAWLKWQEGNKAGGLTILGDIILKDKIITYDLINNRLGWKNYDCSLPINISTNTIIVNATINSGHSGQKASRVREYAIAAGVLALVVIVITVVVIYRFR